MSTIHESRLDYLDAARAFALLLGVVFHASLSFLPFFIGWAVMDIETSDVVGIFMLISHSFRMALFFLIAGFFSHMTYHKQGGMGFVRSRFVRIGIPFVVGWFLFRALLISGWIMGSESLRGDVNIINGLIGGFASLQTLPTDLFTGTHLWFLYYLLLLTTILLLIRHVFAFWPSFYQQFVSRCDQIVIWLSHSKLTVVLLAVPTTYALGYMTHWGLDTPDRSLVPHLPITAIYGGFFLLGWLLHRQTIAGIPALEKLTQLSWGVIVLCLISIFSSVVLSQYELKTGHPNYGVIKLGFNFSYAVMMWSLALICIGVCRRLLPLNIKAKGQHQMLDANANSKRLASHKAKDMIRYLADASYWIYLIHLPLVVWLQIAFAESPLYWGFKWLCVSLITISLALLSYDVLVRPTVIGAVLNGKKKPSLLLKPKN